MKKKALSGKRSAGLFVILDDEDFKDLKDRNIQARHKGDGRICPSIWDNGYYKYLSRFLMKPPPHMVVDHINGDPLDNRRCNLRICTQRENNFNRRKRLTASSKFKGVTFHKKSRKWQAQIKMDGDLIYLGVFAEERDAAMAYNAAAKEFHGQFAMLNEVNE